MAKKDSLDGLPKQPRTLHPPADASPSAWKQKGAYAAAFEEAMVSAHNAR